MIKLYRDYLIKHSFCPSQILEKPDTELGIIVVIPCFNEPDLISSLESLRNCKKPTCVVEVIVVINASENSSQEIIFQNEKTFSDTKKWIENFNNERLNFFLLKNNFLPEKHAGVGLARKIGMDEAVARFEKISNENGIIVCFDADCICDKNYLAEIENHFKKNRETPACSIYFEHPIDTTPKGFETHSELIKEGIIQYELYLRYYKQGLKFAGHPAAFHTIGSSMAVRVDVYCRQGGMNRRKAGEDFYFLQKIIPLGNFSEINSTRVIPSPRPSLRVPFGTGKAISGFLKNNSKQIYAEHPNTFIDLKIFCESAEKFYEPKNIPELFVSLPKSVQNFLSENKFEKSVKEISKNSSSKEMFVKRFFRWFDGFSALKFAHFAREHFYKNILVVEAAKKLLTLNGFKTESELERISERELLEIYRKLDTIFFEN